MNTTTPILIKNARIMSSAKNAVGAIIPLLGDLLIVGGKIAALIIADMKNSSPDISTPIPTNTHTINADGMVLSAGLVDAGGHLSEADLLTERRTAIFERALASGITALALMPHSACPLDNPKTIRTILSLNHPKTLPHLLPIAGVSMGFGGEKMSPVGLLLEAGAVGINIDPWPNDPRFLLSALRYLQHFGGVIFANPQWQGFITQGLVHEGAVSAHLGLPAIPTFAETGPMAILREITNSYPTWRPINIKSLSAKGALDRLGGLSSAGIAMMNLHFNDTILLGTSPDHPRFNAHYRTLPPLRSEADRLALSTALAHSLVTGDTNLYIHSNHLTQSRSGADATIVPFGEAKWAGGDMTDLLDSTARFALAHNLPIETWLGAITHRPAKALGVDHSMGTIAVGMNADVCLFSMVDGKTKVHTTIVGGRIAYQA